MGTQRDFDGPFGTQRDFDGPFGHGISDMGFFCANHWNAMGIQLDNQQKKSLQ